MTQWEKIVHYQLVEKAWSAYNKRNIPIQIRMIQTKTFSQEWLETSVEQLTIDCSHDPQVEDFRAKFFQRLRTAIEETIEKAKSTHANIQIVNALDLRDRIVELEKQFRPDGSGLISMIKQCLQDEKNLILKLQNELHIQDNENDTSPMESFHDQPQFSSPYFPQNNFRDSEIFTINIAFQNIIQETNSLRSRIINFNNCYSNSIEDHYAALEQIEIEVQKRTLNGKVETSWNQANNIFRTLNDQVSNILYMLKCWAVDQRRVLNGAQPTIDLETINILANKVANGVLNLYQTLASYDGRGVLDTRPLGLLEELRNSVQGCARTLIMETFVMQGQPKQILLLKGKVNSKLDTAMKVRLLVGQTFQSPNSPSVEASLISKPEAMKVYQDETRTYEPTPAMTLPKNERSMKLDSGTNMCIADFDKIEMPKKRKPCPDERGEKKLNPDEVDNDRVPQRKYYFHFRSKFSCPDLDISNLNIFITSVPVIANTQTKWKDDSWATILWDNACLEIDQNPFKVKEKIECFKLVEIFSNIFRKDTEKGLSPKNKEFLAKKLMSSCSSKHTANPMKGMVTLDMFLTQPLINCLRPGPTPQNESADKEDDVDYEMESVTSKPSKVVKMRPVPFHTWLFEIKKMCTDSALNKSGIPKYWKNGMIEGFICKDLLANELKKKGGKFALYFSEALLGGLTVAWYSFDKRELQRLAPFTPSTFVECNELERRLHDQHQLTHLYPTDKLKKDAFVFASEDIDRITSTDKSLLRNGYVLHCQRLQQIYLPKSTDSPLGLGPDAAVHYYQHPQPQAII